MWPHIDWPSWIQAISTVILVGITILYVIYTKKILFQSISSTYDSKMPVLVFRFLEYSEKKEISERIVNVGSGPALDILLESNDIFKNGNLKGFQKGHTLERWPLPVDNTIGPDNGNSDLQVCYLVNKGNLSILKCSDVELLLTYKDVFGRRYKTRFVDFENKFEPSSRSR